MTRHIFHLSAALVAVAACSSGGDATSPAATGEGEVVAVPEAKAPVFEAIPGEKTCDFRSPAGTAWRTASQGALRVGAFEVMLERLAEGGAIRVAHATEPTRWLYAAGPGRLLHATKVGLRVEEHQGSFAIHEDDGVGCRAPRVREVATSGDVAWVRGSFDDDDSCRALRFEVGFCQPRDGHLTMAARVGDPSFNALTLETLSDADERIYGLGEQFPHDKLDLKGRRIPVLAQEGGVGRGHQPISAAVNTASAGSAGSEDATYYAAPHVLTSRARSLFLENTELSVFDMKDPTALRVRTYAPEVRARILHGKDPLELIERFTEYAGRMPPLPDWANEGAIVALARDLDTSLEHLDALRAAGTAISAVWNQTWPGKAKTFIGEQVLWNWAYNPTYHPGWSAYVDALAARNVKNLCYVNPMFREVPAEARPVARDVFSEGLSLGAFVRNTQGQPYKLPVTAFDVTMLDVTKPSARTWMKSVMGTEMIDKARCDGWMADFAEALPFDAVLDSKQPAASAHNAYPVEWMKINRELLEERGLVGKVLVWNRSGGARTPSVSTLVWEGDQLTTWDKYDGLVSALHGLIGGGFSGIALNHSDTGGYTSLSAGGVGYDRERELLQRWTEMNAFTAVLRTHEGNQPGLNAQVYDAAGVQHFARMSKVYRALASYRRALFEDARTKGWPVVRHLAMHYPDDAESWTVDDEMLLGSEILVAPTKSKCWTWPSCPFDKEVYLPPGKWVHVWSGKVYGSASAGARVTVKAPIGQPAAFYREGSTVGATFVQNLRAAGLM